MREEELLNGWLPQRLIVTSRGEVKVQWFYAGYKRFSEPFFGETITRCLSLPENSDRPVTSAQTLFNCAARADQIQPTAFVYHTSRCGSTLLAQALSCDERTVVLSEVPLLDEILQLPPCVNGDREKLSEELFRSALAILGSKRSPVEHFLFVKTDSWHILFQERIQRWYPDARNILLYRSPMEIAASQMKQPGMHSVPGLLEPALFGLQKEQAQIMNREEYIDRVLASYMDRYVELISRDENAVPANYNDGVEQMLKTVLAECGLATPASVRNAMNERCKFHSKEPRHSFNGDGERLQLAGTYNLSREKYVRLTQLQKQLSTGYGT